jgi:threonyl-tRNA synthetase
MVHRALYGSVERFFGMLIEHYAGAFPVWLSPTQVAIIPIGEKHQAYANEVTEKLKAAGVRVHVDARNAKMPVDAFVERVKKLVETKAAGL